MNLKHKNHSNDSTFILVLYLLLWLFLPIKNELLAQGKEDIQPTKKGKQSTLYFYWGYNRSFFGKTDLHFNGPDYNFTLYDVKGSDRPSKFGAVYFNPSSFTVPQYNFRIGYFFTNNLALSLGIDHMKYIMLREQVATISGVIVPELSATYGGTYLNESININPGFLQFEHTDGLNLVSMDLEYLQTIASFFNNKLALEWNFGIGAGGVIAKTNVKVIGDGLDNKFHLAGFGFSAKTGPRISYNNLFFILGELRGGYIDLPSILIKNDSPESGDHSLRFLEYHIAVGMNIGFRRKGRK